MLVYLVLLSFGWYVGFSICCDVLRELVVSLTTLVGYFVLLVFACVVTFDLVWFDCVGLLTVAGLVRICVLFWGCCLVCLFGLWAGGFFVGGLSGLFVFWGLVLGFWFFCWCWIW